MEKPKKVSLIYENMTEDLIGLSVTYFNSEIVEPSKEGKIVGWDEEKIHLTFGESKKVHKFEYEPEYIMLRLTQKDFTYFNETFRELPKPKPREIPKVEEKPVVVKKKRAPRKPKAKTPTTQVIQW